VLHQTNSSTASATLAAYIFRSTGAHFLIDPDGQIIQTASIARVCHYVGPIKSRCYETATCSPQEKKVLDAIVNGPGSRDQKRMAVNNHERAKSVPYRYPSNYDSLGIEVSGSFDEKTKHYQTPSTAQNLSAIWLIGELLSAFSLTRSDVYRHPQLSYKENDEAARVKF
jgi:N-acetyl-anhydromuramyl-L-alanine amidase AmpD